jgi:hypothetical protein
VAVLPQPQDPIARPDAGAAQGMGQLVGAAVQLGVGGPDVPAHHRRLLRATASMLAQHVAQGEVVQWVHGQVAGAASARRARSSGLITLPVALRGNSSTKWYWRGTL